MSTSQPTLHFAAPAQTARQAHPAGASATLTPLKEAVMTDLATIHPSSRMQSREKQKRMCRRLVAATCVFFVPFVILRRLTETAAERAGNHLSILAEARADASAIIPFIFMG